MVERSLFLLMANSTPWLEAEGQRMVAVQTPQHYSPLLGHSRPWGVSLLNLRHPFLGLGKSCQSQVAAGGGWGLCAGGLSLGASRGRGHAGELGVLPSLYPSRSDSWAH